MSTERATKESAAQSHHASPFFRSGESRAAFFQPKLAVNTPGDHLEQEADRTADRVMSVPAGRAPEKTSFFPAAAQVQRQPKEQTGDVVAEGASITYEQAKDQPGFEEWKAKQTAALKFKLWENQPTELKAGIIGFGLYSAGILGSAFALDPRFRRNTIDALQDTNVLLPLSLLPYSEYFPVSGFKYKLPTAAQAPYTFQTEFNFDAWLELARDKWAITKVGMSVGIDSVHRGQSGFSPLTGGNIKLKFGGGIVNLSGFYNQPLPPTPMLISDPTRGEPPVWLMRSLPDQLESNLPKGSGVFLTVDVLRLPELFKSDVPKRDTTVQRKEGVSGDAHGNAAGATPAVHQELDAGTGEALPDSTRAFMEQRFDRDFSDVRIHRSERAQKSAESINARAYTSGNDLIFNAGEYQPQTPSGQRLLAHELAHVIQQVGMPAPAVQRQPSAEAVPIQHKPAIVKIVAFAEKTNQAVAELSDAPVPAADDGAPHTRASLNLSRNVLKEGNYTLRRSSTTGGEYKHADRPIDPSKGEDEDEDAAFRWYNPWIDETKRQVKYGWADFVEVEILPGYFDRVFTGGKGAKATPDDIVQMVAAAKILADAGVTEDELLLAEHEAIDRSHVGGLTLEEVDPVIWAESFVKGRPEAEQTSVTQRLTLVAAMRRLERISPHHVNSVVLHLTDEVTAEQQLWAVEMRSPLGRKPLNGTDFDNLRDLWTTLDQFAAALEFELRALAEAVLNATEATILRVQDMFVGGWGHRLNPAMLENELARAAQDPEISRQLQKVRDQEARPPSSGQQAMDALAAASLDLQSMIGGNVVGLVDARPTLETEQYDKQLAADREELNRLVASKSGIKIAGLKGFEATKLFSTGVRAAQSELAFILADGRRTIRDARVHLRGERRFVFGADKIVSGEKAQLGIKPGTVMDRIVTGVVAARLSEKTLWESVWGVVDFLINLLPIPPPAGVILRAVAAGINLGMATDEFSAQSISKDANLSSVGPSASALGATYLLTAAGTVFDASTSKLFIGESTAARLESGVAEPLALEARVPATGHTPVPEPAPAVTPQVPQPPPVVTQHLAARAPAATQHVPARAPGVTQQLPEPASVKSVPDTPGGPKPVREAADPADVPAPVKTEPSPGVTQTPPSRSDAELLADFKKGVEDLRTQANAANERVKRLEDDWNKARVDKDRAENAGKTATSARNKEEASAAKTAFDDAEKKIKETESQLREARVNNRTLQRELSKYENLAERLHAKITGKSYWQTLNVHNMSKAELALYGELQTTARMQEKGFQAVGKTPNPQNVVTRAEWEAALASHTGQKGIDGIYKRTLPDGTTEWWVGECKATGQVGRRSAPSGKGRIKAPSAGDQLSDNWLIDHIHNSGLSVTEKRELQLAIESNQARRFYSDVTADGPVLYDVQRDGFTKVKPLGDPILTF